MFLHDHTIVWCQLLTISLHQPFTLLVGWWVFFTFYKQSSISFCRSLVMYIQPFDFLSNPFVWGSHSLSPFPSLSLSHTHEKSDEAIWLSPFYHELCCWSGAECVFDCVRFLMIDIHTLFDSFFQSRCVWFRSFELVHVHQVCLTLGPVFFIHIDWMGNGNFIIRIAPHSSLFTELWIKIFAFFVLFFCFVCCC